MAGGLAFFAVLGLVAVGRRRAGAARGGASVRVNLGDDVFQPGEAERRWPRRSPSGGPLLFPGLVGTPGRGRIGVYHVGTDPLRGLEGVLARAARRAVELRRARWTRPSRELVDPCTGAALPGRRRGPRPRALGRSTTDGDLVIDLTPGGRARPRAPPCWPPPQRTSLSAVGAQATTP